MDHIQQWRNLQSGMKKIKNFSKNAHFKIFMHSYLMIDKNITLTRCYIVGSCLKVDSKKLTIGHMYI